jgi:hypothetical protein
VSATSASNSASAASTSETNAATSAANSLSSATSASNSATAANTSAVDAAASAVTATTQAASAATSATTATTKASEASASASSAASSATTATTKAAEASVSASNAATSATSASTSASNAATSATSSANSATAAGNSATNAALSASSASTSATNANTSANSAISAQAAAEAARDQALAAFDNFDDKYLGEKTSDPTTDNDGNPLVAGALYFNSVIQGMKVYTGTAWVAAYMSGAGYMLASNNLSELTNLVTARSNLGLGSSALANGYTLDELNDVVVTSVTDGQVLEYDSATNTWRNTTINALPSQATHTGQFLTTDGTNAAWASITGLPPQASYAGQYLKTDGTNASWAAFELPTSTYTRTSFTATAGQTTFSVTYTLNSIQVYVNGVLLSTSDYTATNGTSFVLASAANLGDFVEAVVYNTYGLGEVLAENIIGTVAIGSGGTGATTASGARTSLGLGTAATTDSTAYATSAQGTKADSALQPANIGVSVQSYNANTVIDSAYVHTDNNYTTAEKSKLAGIESGAEVNVNADWNATTGDAAILNKPTLGTMSSQNADNVNITGGSITSGMVTSALGYTPYNSTNPSNYITTAGARSAISVTGAGSYDSATGVINIVGGVTSFNTRTGAISLTSGDVTGALGFTPYNSTNPNGYITSSALNPYLTSASAASTYLSFSGGTLTGKLKVSLAGGTTPSNFFEINNTSVATGNKSGIQVNNGSGWSTTFFTENGAWWHAFGDDTGTYRWGYDGTNLKVGTNTVIHAGNYTSYAMPSGSSATNSVDVRAPIFYDSADTGYYVNPNGASNIGSLTSNSIANVQTGSASAVYQQIENTNTAGVFAYLRLTTFGAGNGYLIKNRTTGNGVSDQSLYLWNEPGPIEFVPNGNPALRTTISTTGAMTIRGPAASQLTLVGTEADLWLTSTGPNSTWRILGSTSSDTHRFRIYDHTNSAERFSINSNGNVSAQIDMRAPIFYDSNDTTYFTDPNNISSLYGIAVRGDQNSTDSRNQIFFWGAGDTTTSAIGFKLNGGEFPNPTGAGDGYNTYFTMDTPGRGWVFREGVGGSNFNAAVTSGWILNNGIWQANASMRSPVFYDSNNTAYYLDPASTSNLNALTFVGTAQWTGSAGALAFNLASGDGYASMRVIQNKTASGTNSDGMYIGYENGNSGITRIFGGGASGGPMIKYASYTEEANSFRAPIFYDSNDTAYYTDPASTSVLNALNVNNSTYIGANLGIGVAPGSTISGARMEIRGSGVWDCGFNITNTGSGGQTWTMFSTNNSFGQGGNRFLLYNATAGTNGFAVDSSNNLTVGGNVTAYGTVSDRRLKHNIREIPTAIKQVLALRPVYYSWNEDTDQHRIAGMTDDLGFIAQDAEEVEPLLVRAGTDGMLGLRERGIIALLTKAFQEQNKEVVNFKSEVAELKSLINKLIKD